MMEMKDESSVRAKIHKQVVEFLGSSWQNVTPDQLVVTAMQGGYINEIYSCGIPAKDGQDVEKVLIRFYGRGGSNLAENITGPIESKQVIVSYIMGECNLGAKILGIFPGGRIERFIPSNTLTDDDMQSHDVNVVVARKMAKFHSLNVPLANRTTVLTTMVSSCLNLFDECMKSPSDLLRDLVNKLMFDLREEWTWIESVLQKSKAKVTFCHNDVNRNNTLIRSNAPRPLNESDIYLIDYDLCGYNYRSYDIAYFFNQHPIDFSKPNMKSNLEYPSDELQRLFVLEYLKASNSNDSVESVLAEVQFFSMCIFFLHVAGIAQIESQPQLASFFSLDEIQPRLQSLYLQEKKIFLNNNGKGIIGTTVPVRVVGV